MYRVNVLFIALFLSCCCFALPSDSKEVIHIVSDEWTYNYKTGVNEYTGHVVIDQGTTHLTADRLTTKSNAHHKIQEAIAYGLNQPAHYRTLAKMGDTEMHAYANIIKYYPIESNVTFEQNVTLKQGENSFQGQLIHYNSYDQTIAVPERVNSQAVIVYNPDK
jgi:lipopolysaccharide export system protein LptA